MKAGLPPGATIAHLIETDGPGGAERVVVYLVTRLAARGFRNVVLLPERGEGWLAAQLPAAGVSVVPVPLLGVPLATSYRRVREALRAARPAIAHSHEFTMSALGGAAAWRLRLPHVLTMHGGRYYLTRWHRRLALAGAARLAGAAVAVSQTVADQLARDLWPRPRRIALIPNGIPAVPPAEPALRRELHLADADQLVVTVGNLYPVKGHADLLHAAARLVARGRRLHVAIAGRGPEAEALRGLAHTLGIPDRVHLLGLRSDVAAVLRSADVFALSSHSEALPLALLEAMRAALPIVATAVGEVPIVLQQGRAGHVVPPADAAALADALDVVLADPDQARALGARAAEAAAHEYDLDRMTDRYLRLYGEVNAGS